MSRYRGPKLRITRRLGLLPGLTTKTSNKKYGPGKGEYESKKTTEYGLRLEEKQKLKFNYGLTENQLYKYVKEAKRRKGVTGLILLQLLGMRLDTICFNLGFSTSIGQARQLVNHGHIAVNQEVVNIPSFQCKLKDLIGVKPKPRIQNLVKNNLKNNRTNKLPTHLKFNKLTLEAMVQDYCYRNELSLPLDELLVIEYYSRR